MIRQVCVEDVTGGLADSILLCCASSEERCVEVGRALSRMSNIRGMTAVQICHDRGYEEFSRRCWTLSEEHSKVLKEAAGGKEFKEFKGKLSRLDALVDEVVAHVEQSNGVFVLDLTCFPKGVFFPVVRTLAHLPGKRRFFVGYVTALEYPYELSRDFAEVRPVQGFVGEYGGGKEHAWVPILGFQGGLARKIWQSGGFGSRVYPVIGFPSWEVKRTRYENRDILEQPEVRPRYSPPHDPKATYDVVRKAVEQRVRLFFVDAEQGPLGPLGLLGAALGRGV